MSASFGFSPFDERPLAPMSAEMFTTLVVARLRAHQDISFEKQRRLVIQLRMRGKQVDVDLHNAYDKYRATPERLDAVVGDFVNTVTSDPTQEPRIESFDEIAPSLLPLLISSAEWQSKRSSGYRLVVRPLVEDVGIGLVIDESDSIAFVELDAIPRWEIDVELAYETAIRNLEARSGDSSIGQFEEGSDGLLFDRTRDGYAATRAILPSRQKDWSRRVNGELLLGLPYRDFLVGFGTNHPAVEELKTQVERDARSHEHGLTPRLLVSRNGSLELWDGAGN